MRVRCIVNSVDALDNPAVRNRLQQSIHRDGPDPDLEIGTSYEVIAIHEMDNGIWFLLYTIEEREYLYPYPAEMFEVLDSALPAGWCVKFVENGSGISIKRISFPEWANDDRFYERLLDGDEAIVAAYQKLRSGMSQLGEG